MTRLAGFIPAWWFFQIPTAQGATPGSPSTLFEYGIGVGMVLLIAALWREDRKARIDSQAELDKRYGALVDQLKAIIEGNTRAMTTLADGLAGKISNCPLGRDPVLNAWMRAFMEHSMEERGKVQRPTPEDS